MADGYQRLAAGPTDGTETYYAVPVDTKNDADDREAAWPQHTKTAAALDSDGMRKKKKRVSALTAKMDNPVWYLLKSVFIYLLVFLDVFLNSSVNSDNYEGLVDGRLTNFWPFLFLIVQTSVQVFIFLTLFLMMCNTYLMRIGLPGVVLADFRWLIIAQILYLTLTMVLGIMRILRFQGATSASALDLWDMPGFVVMFVVQNLVAALYYHQVLYSTFRLADEKYYVVDAASRGRSGAFPLYGASAAARSALPTARAATSTPSLN